MKELGHPVKRLFLAKKADSKSISMMSTFEHLQALRHSSSLLQSINHQPRASSPANNASLAAKKHLRENAR